MPSRASSQQREPAPLPPHPASHNGDARRGSRNMLQNAKPQSGAKTAATIRLGASHDLPSSVTHFLCLSSTSNTAVAKKELRRQLLVLRDYCVGVSNKTKGKELLSQGGKNISKKVEATPDFNSCLDVIFATSLVFTEETEDVAKDTLRSIITKLKAVQDCGDDKAFRAAIVEVVNRVLLCTPLLPPAKDTKAAAEHQEEAAAAADAEADAVNEGGKRAKGRKTDSSDAAEPRLRDECLDFLTMEDGSPVLVEGRWKRWLDYFESGYIRYVERLIAEQAKEQQNSAAAASDAEDDEEAQEDNGDAAQAAAPLVESVPFFTARQNYWKSTTSAYAQFCYLLLAIYFVRTKDFSLNYLARVNKLVQYYAYQLDSEDGEPIAVKEGAVDEEEEEESEEEESEEEEEEAAMEEEKEAEPEPEPESPHEVSRGTEAGVQTEEPEPQPEPEPVEEAKEEAEEKEEEVEEEVAQSARSLPPPQYDDTVTRRTRHSPRFAAQPDHQSSVHVAPEAPKQPRRRSHKCFTTQELPEELRPAAEEAEEAAAEEDTQEHSHVPSVRRTTRMDLSEVASSRLREREGAEIDGAKKAIEDARDEAAVEALARDANAQDEVEAMAAEAAEENAEEELEEAAAAERVSHNAEDLRSEAVVEALAKEAEVHDELERMASDAEADNAEADNAEADNAEADNAEADNAEADNAEDTREDAAATEHHAKKDKDEDDEL